ncbi:MAG: pentapeptide repeat-containing protein [Maricaulaceae bacterium]|jgi:uncharacterized protein YjbI with pentapeptide repeats
MKPDARTRPLARLKARDLTATTLRGLTAAIVCAAAFTAVAAADEVNLRQSIGGVCSDCDFAGRDLENAPIVGNLPRSIFSGAILADARLSGNFTGADFARADLTGAEVTSANLANADFSGAKLDEAQIVGTNFFSVDLTGATLRGASLSSTNLVDAQLLGAKFNNAVFDGLTAARAEFTRADLTGARFLSANLARAEFVDAVMIGADLTGANAQGADFAGADLTDAKLSEVDFSGAKLADAIGLTSAMLGDACGDEETTLPPGLQLAACADSQPRFSRARNWRRMVLSRDDATLLVFSSASPYPAPPASPADADQPRNEEADRRARVLFRRIAAAHAAIAPAQAAAYGNLDLDVRDAVARASAALTDIDASSYASARAGFEQAIEALADIESRVRSGTARAAIVEARRELESELNILNGADADPFEPTDAPAALDAGLRQALLEAESARDAEFAARRAARTLDARARALDAECNQRLDAIEQSRNAVDSSADEATLNALAAQVQAACRADAAQLDAERATLGPED